MPRIYSCDHCTFSASHKGNFFKHVAAVHQKPVDRANYRRLGRHCRYCDQRVASSRKLLAHLRLQHSAQVEVHRCDFCSFRSLYRSSLQYHVQYHVGQAAGRLACPHCQFVSTKYKVRIKN